MTISLHSLNYPYHTFGYMNKHRISQYSTRTNPALAIPPSSILLQNDESGNLLDSKKIPGSNAACDSVGTTSLLNHDNTVGIIGGVSIHSTLNFLKKLVHWSTKEGEDCPPFVLCSNPAPSISEGFQTDCAPLENLRRERVFLEKSGARCIVMPCHVSHTWHDEVSRGCSVPFLHMGECVARELKEANLRPVETGSPLRIGVLAADATLKTDFYQEKLRNEGFEVVLPDKATIDHTVIPAVEAFNRRDMEGAQNLLRIALQVILLRAVNTVVILASDDMRELLPHDDPILKKCVDPLDALARSTIKWTRSARKGS
ncbi:hypothetical protein RHSIM_Rhsim08G0216000 [Rhododendron simsii]|uniref:Aspartate racemase n=1 Tax=Rhododendron simsii TaxID=118357 RepID=A0A834GI14_RHOSS|nr:hypothetical protein RHSIM_Rhsim08G0216000 [Rhododendron simsii]